MRALVGLAGAGCADDVSPALRIGDTKIGNEAFLDEVAEWVGNPVAIDPSVVAGSSPGTYPLELVRQLLQQRIDFELHNQQFEELGLELDDDLRDEALAALFGDPEASVEASRTRRRVWPVGDGLSSAAAAPATRSWP